MWYNLKLAFRNLRRNGIYSIINIVGLTVSFMAVILIMLWVDDELSYDKFHKRSKDIYLTVVSFTHNDNDIYWKVTPAPLAHAGKAEIPEVENACRIFQWWQVDFIKHNKNVLTDVQCLMADSSFFSIFNFEVKGGDIKSLLSDDYSVVLSESAVKILFGDENPIGKIITDHSGREFHVTGIIADVPQNSSYRFDILLNFTLLESLSPDIKERWYQMNYETCFLLNSEADASEAAQKLTGIYNRNAQGERKCLLMPLEHQNLYNEDGTANTKLQACHLFFGIAIALLLIACINYVNLVTSRASRRNKEVYVRTVTGARKRNLFALFFSESLLLFFCSLITATLLIYALLSTYNEITGKQLEFQLLSPSTMSIYGLVFVITGLLAGIYPAFKLMQRTGEQKEIISRSNVAVFIRRSLIVLQFTASVTMMLATVVVNRQLHYIKTMNPGYDRENVLYVQLSENMRKHRNAIKIQLSQTPGIEKITFTQHNLSEVGHFDSGVYWEGKDIDLTFIIMLTDKDFIPAMNIKMLEGANFTGMPADSAYYIVNHAAVKAMGMQDPVGKKLSFWEDGQIIGVTEDFHFQSIYEPVEPLLIAVAERWPPLNFMYVKVGANNISEALQAIENVCKQYDSEIPFDYHFMDSEFERIYKTDIRTGSLFNVFSIIAIFISCLGLFGLVTYTAESKTKEIGIRKVLGASVGTIVKMLSKEFLILVGIAMLIAFPLAYYWMNNLLQNYAYRISISWWMFAIAAAITVVLTLLTVGFQAIKAATANPVKAIQAN